MRPHARLAAPLMLVSCIQPATYLDDAPCPCDEGDGYVCCAATGTCRVEDACPSSVMAPVVTLEAIRPDIGLYGETTEATIEGTGFLPGMVVSVGSERCLELEIVSTTHARCVVPRGTPSVARVDVLAALESGETAALPKAFRYVLPPFVDVTPTAGIDRSFGFGPTVIDWDDDGALDLLYPNVDEPSPVLFLNRGPLSYVRTPIDIEWTESIRAITADFTGDGRLDVMIGGRYDYFLAVYTRDEEGDWRVANNPLHNPQRGGFVGPSPADLDGDGDLDVIGCRNVIHESTRPMVYAENLGNGRFVDDPTRVPERLRTDDPTPYCNDGVLGDFDRDGDADYLACGEHIALLENQDGRFVEITEAAGLPHTLTDDERTGCRTIDWVDFDADGDLDIAWVYGHDALRAEESGTVLFENRRSDGADPPFVNVRNLQDDVQNLACPPVANDRPLASLHAGAKAAFWLDADHDGDEDLLLPLASARCLTPVTLYENHHAQGQPRFVASFVPTNGVFAQATAGAVADLDADGDLDVAVQGWGHGGGDRGIFRNNLMENAGTIVGPRGRYLRVRAPAGTTVEIDLDGGPGGTPDFGLGVGRLVVRHVGPRSKGGTEPVAHFGLGEVEGPVWVRTTDRPNSILEVHALDREVELPQD